MPNIRQPKKVTVAQVAAVVAEDPQIMNKELAARLGISLAWAGKLRMRAGMPKGNRGRITVEQRARIKELIADGWPAKEIAIDVGLSQDCILENFPEAGQFGSEWAAVHNWAVWNCPDLLASIKRMEIA